VIFVDVCAKMRPLFFFGGVFFLTLRKLTHRAPKERANRIALNPAKLGHPRRPARHPMALRELLLIVVVALATGSEVVEPAAAPPGPPPCFVNGMQVDPSICTSPPPPFPGPPPPLKPPHLPPPPPPELSLMAQAATSPYVLGAAGVAVVGVGAYAVMKRAGYVAMS
jgi:hypothetical protein